MTPDKLAKEIEPLVENEFCQRLFQASIKNVKDFTNPLRVNNFSYSLRGLIDNMLAQLAPADEIKKCIWFDDDVHTYERNGILVPNRLSQIKYAIQAGLDDEFLLTELDIDIEARVKKLLNVYSKFNKYTHITEKTFDVSAVKATVIIEESLTAVLKFLRLIKEIKKELYSNLEQKVFDTVRLQSTLESVGSLDEIASHYSIDSIYLENFKIKSIDSTFIVVEAEGSISVVHQWGSNADLNNGDGLEIDHSHPFVSKISFLCDDPKDWDMDESSFEVDTSDWYDGYYDFS